MGAGNFQAIVAMDLNQLSLISLGSDHQVICFMVSKMLILRSLRFTFFLWVLFPFSNFKVVSEIKEVDICVPFSHSVLSDSLRPH